MPRFGFFEATNSYQNPKYGLVNFLGEYRLPPDYDEITFSPRTSAMAAVRQGKLWDLIGFQAEILAAAQFDSIQPDGARYKVTKDGETYWVNERGQRK